METCGKDNWVADFRYFKFEMPVDYSSEVHIFLRRILM